MLRKTVITLLIIGLSPFGWAQETDDTTEASPATVATAPLVDRETSINATLRQHAQEGEVIELQGEKGNFIALYRQEQRGEAEGGIILLHGINTHADWPGVIGPLRRQLPLKGWHTLSLQLPFFLDELPQDKLISLLDSANKRLESAKGFFAGKGIENIVLIGHGLGATLAADYLSANENHGLQGAVFIALANHDGATERLDTSTRFDAIKVPFLDLYGDHDQPHVTTDGRKRRKVIERKVREARAAQPKGKGWPPKPVTPYRQVVIAGADQGFIGMEDTLIRRVRGWLKQHASGIEVGKR